MNPIWIGILGTAIALFALFSAVRLIIRTRGASMIPKLHALIAVLFLGVIWFIILRLLPGG